MRLERENGEPVKDTFPGLQTLVGTTINASEMGKMRIVHEFMQYDTVLASARAVRDGSAPELARGYVRCTPRKLTKEERAAYLKPTDDDGPAMLKALKSAGLQRTKDCCTGRYDMPDWMFVQRLAFKIFDHVKYDAGKSVALNSGKPPSNIFICGYAECGKFTAATVNACRVSGIPARGLLNNPHCYDDPFFFGTHGGVAVYLEHAGWVHYEPQNRVLGDYTWGLDCDTGITPVPGCTRRELTITRLSIVVLSACNMPWAAVCFSISPTEATASRACPWDTWRTCRKNTKSVSYADERRTELLSPDQPDEVAGFQSQSRG